MCPTAPMAPGATGVGARDTAVGRTAARLCPGVPQTATHARRAAVDAGDAGKATPRDLTVRFAAIGQAQVSGPLPSGRWCEGGCGARDVRRVLRLCCAGPRVPRPPEFPPVVLAAGVVVEEVGSGDTSAHGRSAVSAVGGSDAVAMVSGTGAE
jgi:hypothetical protein